MPHNRQQLRLWAARVLFLWLFGLGAGVANACLLPAHVAPVRATMATPADAEAGHHPAASHQHEPADQATVPAPDADDPPHHGHHAKSNCQDFCTKAAVAVPSQKSALDDVPSHAAAVASAALTYLPVPGFATRPLWVPRRDGVLAPPVRIAFVRLAL